MDKKRLYTKIIEKILSIDRKITSRNTHFAISEIVAMIVGIAVVIAGFVALFMWINDQKQAKEGEAGKDSKGAQKQPEKGQENQKENNKAQAEKLANMFANMNANNNKKEENKDNKTSPPQQEQPAHSANEGNANPFADIMKNMPKPPSSNEQKSESSSNNQGNKIMPTINANQQQIQQPPQQNNKQPVKKKQSSMLPSGMLNLDNVNGTNKEKDNNMGFSFGS